MLTFAAIVPHPPLLLPSVGGEESTKKLAVTAESFRNLEQALYVTHPEVLVIISPHGNGPADALMLNFAAQYTVQFKEFGDFQTQRTFHSDVLLMDHMQRLARKEVPLVVASQEQLDYGTGIPLVQLTEHLPHTTIVPISTCGLDTKTHFEAGKMFKEEILNSNKRIAVIASADLSHTLTTDAPGGFAKEGKDLDELVNQLIATRNTAGMISIDAELMSKAKECGIRPISVLLGILSGMEYQNKIYSYEAPFGVGYLTSQFLFT